MPAGGKVSGRRSTAVALTTPHAVELTVVVERGHAGRDGRDEQRRHATVDVTELELARSRLLVDGLGGYGAQFNQHVYAAITPRRRVASGPRGEGEGARAAARRGSSSTTHQEPTPTRWRRSSRPSSSRTRPERRSTSPTTTATPREDPARSVHGPVRRDPRGPRPDARLHERPLGHDPERAELDARDARAVRGPQPRAPRRSSSPAGCATRSGSWRGDLVESGGGGTTASGCTYIAEHMPTSSTRTRCTSTGTTGTSRGWSSGCGTSGKLMMEELPASARKPVYITEFGVARHPQLAGTSRARSRLLGGRARRSPGRTSQRSSSSGSTSLRLSSATAGRASGTPSGASTTTRTRPTG